MATKSSIHIKPCNITSSEAHNRRTPEYMRNIGDSKIYIVPELSADNEQWINPSFGNVALQTHYDNIKRMVKEKTERLSRWPGARPSVKEYCLSKQIPPWMIFADFVIYANSVVESAVRNATLKKDDEINNLKVSIRPGAYLFPFFSFLPLCLHYNLNPLSRCS